MSRIKIHPNSVDIWLSHRDTAEWASWCWPGSTLTSKRVRASFDSHGLVDFAINGNRDTDCPPGEFDAIVFDYFCDKLSSDHPAWFIIIGQFEWMGGRT